MQRAEVDENFVRGLLRQQHPDLADREIRPVSGGWDNQLWRLGADLAVRLPMTERAPALLAKEFRWLPEIAPRLPLPVPTPRRFSTPVVPFSKPWSIVSWVPGSPADGVEVTEAAASAEVLADFLRALHLPAPSDAPTNPSRTTPLPQLSDVFETQLVELAELVDSPVAVRRVWERAIAAPEWSGRPVWLHADLHPANAVLVEGALAGIVDFGELCAGDPAIDLAAAWKLLPQGAATAFLTDYGVSDEATVHRAQGWAVLTAFSLLSIGRAWDRGEPGGKPTWGRAGRRTLERVLAFG
ncbi:aminoglycoside phosphotransferase family protein [Actinoalloteichus hymeniacidonis]|uniref:Aminoglycoside phosphotransferase n=1 Tax=Actinoalloteichus hymeniacidonis TaxID=340345 RepID=A0AAC9MYT7_9PSEU|nr:aminoglycoside phosphotransferase family protein [Actinoalloteichus hymeniacidonis]AOS63794.1 putative aminoglycoside phosphotransferase [Actinoalloteichus hymeniacidonis]MBB5908152.1 aminoglycoside phosphotransferase (APT) family kinase protein [Actinoalloteichus hymeniacidonis]